MPLPAMSSAYLGVISLSCGTTILLPTVISSAVHLMPVMRVSISVSLTRIIVGPPVVMRLSSSLVSLVPFLILPFLSPLASRTSLKPSMRFLKADLPRTTSTSWPSCSTVRIFIVVPGLRIERRDSSVRGCPISSSIVSSGLSEARSVSPASALTAPAILRSLSSLILRRTSSASSSQIMSPATKSLSPSSMTLTLLSGATFRRITSMCLLLMLTP